VKDLPFFLTVEEVLAFHADQIRGDDLQWVTG
jgi:hypothetical protein